MTSRHGLPQTGPSRKAPAWRKNAGWQARLGTPGFCNAGDERKAHFPAFHVEAATMLLEEVDVAGVGVDTLSIDYGLSADCITHDTWLPANCWAVENMANFDQLPATDATLLVGAPRHQGGTGGPCRLIALVRSVSLDKQGSGQA